MSWKHLLWWWCFKDNTFRKSNLILTFWKPFNSSCFETLSFFPLSHFFVFTTEKNWGLGGRKGHAPCPSVPPTLNMWVFITCTPEVSTYCKGFLNSAKCHLTRKWLSIALRKKCPYSEFFWTVFSRIRTEYREMRSIPPYSVQMRQKTDQKNSKYEQTLHLFGLVEQTSVGFERASFYCRKNEVFH